MNRNVLTLCLAGSLTMLTGCGMLFKNENAPFKNHGMDYLEAAPLAVIELPEGVDTPEYTPLFPVAELQTTDEFGDKLVLREYDVPRPDSPYNSDASSGVKIQKIGENQWVALGVPTNQAWPSVQNYLAVNSIPIVNSSAPEGLIETDWLKFSNDEDSAIRFKILIDKGLYPETTEVRVLQSQTRFEGEDLPTDLPWPAVSDDFERETWLVRQIAEHLAQSVDSSSASLLGQDVGGPVKASFGLVGGSPVMRLRLDSERAWATLTKAADSNGFVRWEQNKKLGVIHSGFDPELTKDKGFWAKALSMGGSSLPEQAKYPLEKILTHLSADSASKSVFANMPGVAFDTALEDQDQGYLIVVSQDGEQSTVMIRDQRGRLLLSDKAKALLRALRSNLI